MRCTPAQFSVFENMIRNFATANNLAYDIHAIKCSDDVMMHTANMAFTKTVCEDDCKRYDHAQYSVKFAEVDSLVEAGVGMFVDVLHQFELREKYWFGSTSNEPAVAPTIKDVIFNPPATIVFWSDNTKTIVRAQGDETYDPEKGIAMAISKKMLGNKYDYYHTFLRYQKKWEAQMEKIREEYQF